MQWSEVIDNPYFKNLPFKIELNRYGKVEMTPASNKRGRLQFHIGTLLERKLKKGEVLTECSVQTTDGVKVADVAWCSNSKEEMSNKVQLYLQAGAEECWIVWKNGIVDYYGKTGKLELSGYGVSIKLPVN